MQFAPPNASQPIGIFDSGIGGLTVAKAIRKLLPAETLIYFGDTAHFPYGDRSEESILFYSLKIARFLQQQHCKIIVIACNTASSYAFEMLENFMQEHQITVINVIDPVVNEVATLPHLQKTGVIGTKGTIQSGIYEKKLRALNPNLNIAPLATPLLAPMIEEGFFSQKISKTIIGSYLDHPILAGIDSLILACTHYPLIRREINALYEEKVAIIDSAEIVARHVAKVLEEKGLLHEGKGGKHHFYVSDYTDTFGKSAGRFFHHHIRLEEADIWGLNNISKAIQQAEAEDAAGEPLI